MPTPSAAIASITLSILLAFLVRFLMLRFRHSSPNKDSETGSSDPSAKRGAAIAARQFRMEELEQATMEFNESNIIGCGAFGLVFKGLLRDGTVVAIKRRDSLPRHDRNSLTRHQQRFDHEARIQAKAIIAIGAAKGLCHLHGLQPPSIHSNFKTSNVLVDENFIAKVADARLWKLVEKIKDEYDAGSSCSNSFNAFRDPEFRVLDPFQDRNDVYNFGVFLLELVSGKETNYEEAFRSNDIIYQWDRLRSDDLIDEQMNESFSEEGMKEVIKLMVKGMMFPRRERPRMENVVMELDGLLKDEITRTTLMGECSATVTLGSQLFTN